MALFTRTELDATWVSGYAPTPADLINLDSKIKRAINGDDGGAWSPTAALNLSNLQVTGPLVVFREGILRTSGTARFQLGDADYPVFGATHPARSRRLVTSCIVGTTSPGPIGGFSSIVRFDYGGRQTIAGGSFINSFDPMPDPFVAAQLSNYPTVNGGTYILGAARAVPVTLYVPLRVHNGGTISSATITFRVGVVHAVLPTPPRFRIVRIDASGIVTPLTSALAGGDANGWVPYSPITTVGSVGDTSIENWSPLAGTKSFTINCDVSNVIDMSLFQYFCEIQEEGGGIPIPIKGPVACAATTSINLTTLPASIDGVAIAANTRFLLTAQTDGSGNPTPALNGIWSGIAGGAPSREPDLSNYQFFGGPRAPGNSATSPESNAIQGSLVYVSGGTNNGRKYWQQTSPTLDSVDIGQGPAPQSLANGPITYAPLAVSGFAIAPQAIAGNIWIAVAINHTNIADARFQ